MGRIINKFFVVFCIMYIFPAFGIAQMARLSEDQTHSVWIYNRPFNDRKNLLEEYLDKLRRQKAHSISSNFKWIQLASGEYVYLFGNSLYEDFFENYFVKNGTFYTLINVEEDIYRENITYCDEDGIWGTPDSCQGCIGLDEFRVEDIRATTVWYDQDDLMQITAGVDDDDGTYVNLRLGRIEAQLASAEFNVAMGPTNRLGQELGSIYWKGLHLMTEPDSEVYMYFWEDGEHEEIQEFDGVLSTTKTNLVTDVDVTLKFLEWDVLSWGDRDGIGNGHTEPGYIGLTNMRIDNLSVVGLASIHHATIEETSDPELKKLYKAMYKSGKLLKNKGEYVRIGMGDMNVAFDSMQTALDLGASRDLSNSTTAFRLGNIAVSNLNVRMDGYIDLFAH